MQMQPVKKPTLSRLSNMIDEDIDIPRRRLFDDDEDDDFPPIPFVSPEHYNFPAIHPPIVSQPLLDDLDEHEDELSLHLLHVNHIIHIHTLHAEMNELKKEVSQLHDSNRLLFIELNNIISHCARPRRSTCADCVWFNANNNNDNPEFNVDNIVLNQNS